MEANHPKILSGEWYIGKPCRFQGHTVRRVTDDRCVQCRLECERRDRQNNKRKRPNTDNRRRYQSEWQKQKRLKNLEESRASKRLHQSKRRSLKAQATIEPISKTDIEALLAQFGHSCAYCGSTGKLTLDHIYPINGGGVHALSNLVPACHSCNSSKSDSHPLDWYEKQVCYSKDRLRHIALTKGLTRWIKIYGLDGDGSTL